MTRLRRFAASAGQAHGARTAIAALTLLGAPDSALAHSGPPFPIVTDVVRAPYTISIWTDPDATDNGTPGGQFWIVIASSTERRHTVRRDAGDGGPCGPSAPPSPVTDHGCNSARTEPCAAMWTNQFGAVALGPPREPYAVHVEVIGPMGPGGESMTMVDATYDLRATRPYRLVWYLFPFHARVGSLWTRLLLRRRAGACPPEQQAKAGLPSDRVSCRDCFSSPQGARRRQRCCLA
jgi:hypothetical protein